jgi:hypothetical protein
MVHNGHRWTVAGVILIALIAIAPSSRQAAAQSACSQIADAFEFKTCVSQLADLYCQGSGSYAAHQDCFIATAQQLIGDRMGEVLWQPQCYYMSDTIIQCVVNSDGYGAPDDWCIRLDADRIQRCEGDPPNQVCREPEYCSVAQQCALCWVPN